jgi:hypothetical protein
MMVGCVLARNHLSVSARGGSGTAAPGPRQPRAPSLYTITTYTNTIRVDRHKKKRNEETLRRQNLFEGGATSPLHYPSALLLLSLSSFQNADRIVPPTSRSRSRRGFQDSKTHRRRYDPMMSAGLSSPVTSLQSIFY